MKALPLIFLLLLCGCKEWITPPDNNNDSISIAEIRLQLESNRMELLNVRDNVDSALSLIDLMDSNMAALERRTAFIEKDRSYRDTLYIHDTVRYHQFIGNGNLFIKADKLIEMDTLGIWMNDSVFFKIWADGSEITNI